MKPSEAFAKLCEELQISDENTIAQAEIIYRAGYKKGKDDEWARVLAKCEDL